MKVIYIMSSACSGSTLLDIVLSSHDGVIGTGELCCLFRCTTMNGECCACGAACETCNFWGKVRGEWSRASGGSTPAEYLALHRKFERLRDLPRLLWADARQAPGLERYRRQTLALYEAIARVSGAPIIVDSSKLPTQALALAEQREVDFYLIHLVRDVRGVVCSYMKDWVQDENGELVARPSGRWPVSVGLRWMLFNAIANRVRAIAGTRSILIRYEDLVQDPERELSRVSELTGVNFSGNGSHLAAGGAFHPGHQIAGNRLRMKSRVRLKPDFGWHRELSALCRHYLPMLTFPVSYPYGYRVVPGVSLAFRERT